MAGEDEEAERLAALGKRLDEAQQRLAPAPPTEAGAKSYAQGMRLVAELLAGVAGGALIGWLFDRWFGTTPLFMVGLLFLGAAAAIRSSMKAATPGNEKIR